MNQCKVISVIGTVGVPSNYGGFETLVDNILDSERYKMIVYCSSKHYKNKLKEYKRAKLLYLPLDANGMSSIFYDFFSMMLAVLRKTDVMLVLGVSGCFFLPFVRLFFKKKIITNIDGLEWKRDKWGKWARIFLKYSEGMAIKYSDIIVSDNKAIADYVRSTYDVNSNVIAYGGDHAYFCDGNKDDGYALALCRIEPENNIAMILESFSDSGMKLKFVGNWDRSEFGVSLKEKYKSCSNIELIDPVYDIHKLAVLRSGCHIYIHGHSAGGTNPSLVEMMHFAKPILCFDCSYNRATTEDRAKYFSNAEELQSLISAEIDPSAGLAMQEIAQRRYTWDIVRQQYYDLF